MKISSMNSHVFDVRNLISGKGPPIRPSRFLEEKKWPPRETIRNQRNGEKTCVDMTWDRIGSHQPLQPHKILEKQMMSIDAINTTSSSGLKINNINDSEKRFESNLKINNSFQHQFGPPFRLNEVTSIS